MFIILKKALIVCLSLVMLGSAIAAETKVKIILVGDSTVTDSAGWGWPSKSF